MSACIGEPVSWLRLERYGLGELSESEAAQVASHLAGCPACGTCYAQLRADARGAEVLTAPPLRAARVTKGNNSPWLRAALGSLLGAVLGAWLLFARGPDMEPPDHAAPARPSAPVKGGELALELVRMDARGQQRAPSGFVPGDRFKVRVTCTDPTRTLYVRAFQGSEVFEPLPPQRLLRCGNLEPVPGALQFDGAEPVALCVVMPAARVADAAHAVARARAPSQLPDDSACVRLVPE